MSKQQHTPGNWVIRGREIGVRDTSDTQSYGMMLTICQVDEWDFKEHWQANARLIAAAPELLEALESVEREHELLRWMKNCELQRPRGSFGIAVESDELALEWQSHRKNLDKLADSRRAAIARARGE